MSLNNDAIQQALADHERDSHGVAAPVAIPDDCLADVKQRYDTITAHDPIPNLPDNAAETITEMLWTRGMGNRASTKIAGEDIVGWIKKELRANVS